MASRGTRLLGPMLLKGILLCACGATAARAVVDSSTQSAFGVYSSHGTNPTFMISAGLDQEGFYEWSDGHMSALGAHWTRFSLAAAWQFIEPILGGGYNWTTTAGPGGAPDPLLAAVYESPNDIHAVVNIQSLSFGTGAPTRSPFTNPAEYRAFVQALAERYDGDGNQDAPTASTIKVNYFQLANELQDWFDRGLSPNDYAQAAKMTLDSLRAANPQAKLVLVGGFSATDGSLDPQFQLAIQACKNLGVDFAAIDIHWWFWTNTAAEVYPSTAPWQSQTIRTARQYLDSLGLNNVQIWSMENASWAGCPSGVPAQTEEDHARTLVKRFVWGRANGLDKLFWSQLVDYYDFEGSSTSLFNSMGLVDDGARNCADASRLNTTRQAYWAYQKLAATTDNLVAAPSGTVAGVHDGVSTFAYRYARRSDSQPLYVLWREGSAGSASLSVSAPLYAATSLLPDRYGNFTSTALAAPGGILTMALSSSPVLVVPVVDASSPTISITNPAGGATISGFTTVDVSASDNAGVTTAAFYVDGVFQSSDTSSPYSFTLDAAQLSAGAHILSAKAYDAAGNVAVSAGVSVTVSGAAGAAGPQGFVLVSGGNMVTVKDGALTKLDPATDQIIAQVSFSTTNVTIAADPPRRLVYAAASDGKLSVFKADTLERADIAVSGLGLIPIGSAVTPDGRTLLLTTRGSDGQRNADDRLDVVSLSTGSWPPTASLSYSVPTGTHPINVMVDHAGRYAVVTVRDDPAVLVLDLGTRQTVLRAAMSFGSEPEGLDMHPTQDVAYALTHGANTIEVLDLTQDPPQFVASVPIWSVFGNPQPSKGKFTPDGRRMFVSAQSINRVLLFDTSVATSPVQDKTVSLPVGLQPHGIVFLPDGRAYVANTNNGGANGSISVLQNVQGTPSVSGSPILASLVGPNIFLSFVVDSSSPSVPAGLTATAAGSSRVELSWTASTDDMGLAGYKVYRGGVQVASATTASYTDHGLSAATAYSYEVAAYDAAGNVSAKSAAASATTAAPSTPVQLDSPFGIHPAVPFDDANKASAKDLGIRWSRDSEAPYLYWSLVDPNRTGDPAQFLWQGTVTKNGQSFPFDYDVLFDAQAAGVNITQNIEVAPKEESSAHYASDSSWMPGDAAAYQTFVREAVKRYSFVRYWQVGNEPNLLPTKARTPSSFADMVKTTYDAIKAADPAAQVLIAGLSGNLTLSDMNSTYYASVLPTLAGSGFDVFDIHYYGDARNGALIGDPQKRMLGYQDYASVHDYYRNLLDANGFAHVPIWISEMSSFSGSIVLNTQTLTQSEAEQAGDLVKRWVYPLSKGVQKIFWAWSIYEGFMAWDDDYFDHTGLVYGGQDGVHQKGDKKLAYYSLKKMAEFLEDVSPSSVQAVQESSGGVHAYRFTRDGRPVWAAWNDGSAQAALTLSGLTSSALTVTDAVPRFGAGAQVSDYATAFSSRVVSAVGGSAVVALSSATPVWIEAATEEVVASVDPNAASLVTLQTSGGTVELSIPAGSFSESVRLTLRRPASCPGSSAGLLATGVCAEIVLDRTLQPSKAAELSIAYRDIDVGGLDEKKLILARYDETHRGWVPLESGVDASANRVTGKTSHFSTFQIMQAGPAEGLDGARVYPNPFRPAKGHAQVVIDGLPAGAGVSIFTLRGKLVWKATASDAGMAVWPGVNRDGREAASGVYFVYVESGGRRRILKAAVVR